MAITKILARKGRLDVGIRYVLNGDKTQEQILTARLNCDPGHECRQMLETKRAVGKEGGVQYYHLIQSFQPGEVTPELALEIAREFAEEHLPGYQTVIGVHVDKEHIHAHILFNSVNADTGEKYHSNAQSYYRQIRAISDRLCRERGLSVLLQGEPTQAVSYIEWLRRSRGQPTFRSMLEEDLRTAIADANDLGHFFLLMEHMGYEISHGNRLGFRLRGQERFVIPGRKNPLFTEDGIRAAIQGNLAAIEAGRRPAVQLRPQYRPYQKYPRYTGFLALYVHYLYLLGKIGKRQYPPRMTPQLRQEVMRFEQYREQFAFLRDNGITTRTDMAAFTARTEEMLKHFLLGAIRRVFRPGSKYEEMLCLVGGQGAGKSSFFRLLAIRDEWFSDDLKKLDDDRVYLKLQGHWIIEMSEMLATSSAKSIEEIRSFISRQKETYRTPYEAQPKDRLRQCVFGGSSNTLDFLPLDRAGNRRFLPIMIYPENAEVHILEDEDASRAYLLQVWAEAMTVYRSEKYSMKFSKSIQRQLVEVQKDFMPEDTEAGQIQGFLEHYTGSMVCSKQLFREALGRTYEEPKRWQLHNINEIMNTVVTGWKPFSNPRMFAGYGRQRGWERDVSGNELPGNEDGFVELTEEECRQLELPKEWIA